MVYEKEFNRFQGMVDHKDQGFSGVSPQSAIVEQGELLIIILHTGNKHLEEQDKIEQ